MVLKDFKNELSNYINQSDRLFIVPHMGADFDAIASCLAVALIANKFKKPFYILLDESSTEMEPGVKKIVDEVKDSFHFLSLDKYENLRHQPEFKDSKNLLVCCDVNRNHLICCKDYLDDFCNTIVIDHHSDVNGINCNLKFVDETMSSASEILTSLLSLFQVDYDKRMAEFLLAGIYLDTNRFSKNVSQNTMIINSKLMKKGADMKNVNALYEEDFQSDRKVQELVSRARFFTYTIAIALANDDVTYTKEELAKVADYLLRFKNDGAIAAGRISDDLISISGRSKGNVDIGYIMTQLGGGGNKFSAAAKIPSQDGMNEVNEQVLKLVRPAFYLDEENK